MYLAIIAAVAENGVIGENNSLPWHLPEDLKYFKRVTMGKPLVMGRKTFESIGKPLPGRVNIIVSQDSEFSQSVVAKHPGVRVTSNPDDAFQIAENIAFLETQDEVMIMGGESLYRYFIAKADRLYMTHVHANIQGDAIFPAIDWQQWQEVSRQDYQADQKNPHDYSMVLYERKAQR